MDLALHSDTDTQLLLQLLPNPGFYISFLPV